MFNKRDYKQQLGYYWKTVINESFLLNTERPVQAFN